MKTNVKISRIPPAFAVITDDSFLLENYFKGKFYSVDSRTKISDSSSSLERKIAALNRSKITPCRLIIVLSAQLTLYSEQVFPSDLSAEQMGELLMLQLAKRTGSADITTYYDYFLLRKTDNSSVYGLLEARKDIIDSWIDGFKLIGLDTVAVISQPIILINQVIKHININTGAFQIVCVLSSRYFIAYIKNRQVEKIVERVMLTDSHSCQSLAKLILNHLLDDGIYQPDHSVIILDAVDCGVVNELNENFTSFSDFNYELSLDENTINWLRAEYDMYQSIALA